VGKLSYLSLCFVLSGCSYSWVENQSIQSTRIHKIESVLAQEFCSNLTGGIKRGCAIRLLNTDNNTNRCVIVVLPNDVEAIQHESAHCLGYDHPIK
jgi:hypothetical protein